MTEMDLLVSLLPLADAWGMHGGDIGTGWVIVMMLGMAVFWGGIAIAVVLLLREAIGHRQSSDPLAILDRRLAEGKLSLEEYEQRKRSLGG